MMRPKIIFCIAVSAAILAVILLALVSPVAHKKAQKNQTKPWVALSLYIQPPKTGNSDQSLTSTNSRGAFIFHHTLTEGPENTSRVVGKAQGFIIPVEHFAHSAFNIIYLTFNMPEYSGSLSIQANHVEHKGREELTVVGGTGAFAFAKGLAVFAESDTQPSNIDAMYHVKLQLKLPHQLRPIPG
ncbi:hypothetical protein AQUCO_00700111v1 [Aquilegia coerulea]|uniref:Dirigent protein n=1 Tax=Aquilegia coerulea TaxID=218851 RepID=A0A2G5EJ03_AQUCA|nr:hypothetical protein AQUCO_00700111v1 [Aquilegia coerulea]